MKFTARVYDDQGVPYLAELEVADDPATAAGNLQVRTISIRPEDTVAGE